MMNFMQFFKLHQNKILILLAVIVVIIYWYAPMPNNKEGVDNTPVASSADVVQTLPNASVDNNTLAGTYTPQQVTVAKSTDVSAKDLLPVYDSANAFSGQNAVSNLLKEQNFLISGFHTGLNTISSSKRIGYLDIRSLPPIPKQQVSPWNNSSYDSPMINRRMFEISGL